MVTIPDLELRDEDAPSLVPNWSQYLEDLLGRQAGVSSVANIIRTVKRGPVVVFLDELGPMGDDSEITMD